MSVHMTGSIPCRVKTAEFIFDYDEAYKALYSLCVQKSEKSRPRRDHNACRG